MNRSLKRKKERSNKSTLQTQQKIMRRLQQTTEIISGLSIEELTNIVKTKKVELLDKSFRCSSTDIIAVHQVLKKKYEERKLQQKDETRNI